MTAQSRNPFTWVEIYVEDMSRARKFYENVFDIKLTEMQIPDGIGELQMLSFPWADDGRNISGALVKTKSMNSGTGGTVVYFACEDCSVEESRVESSGGKVSKAKMPIGQYGFCSIVLDTEGNTIGLHSMK